MRAVSRLHRMYCDYPTSAVRTAVRTALDFGLTDLERIERMVLRTVAGEFFKLAIEPDPQDEDPSQEG